MSLLAHLPTLPHRTQLDAPIGKINDDLFVKQRYNDRHRVLVLEQGGKSTYCLRDSSDGKKELLIIDIVPLTPLHLAETVHKLYHLSVAEAVNSVFYVGNIPFPTAKIMRIPRFIHRSHRIILGKILNPKVVDDRVYEIKNWSFNLSNMDVP
jgi:hypothetical protein